MKKSVCCICASILILTLIGSFPVIPAAAAPPSFTVNTLNDSYDSNPGDGVCDDGMIGCSLRAAIEEAYWVSSESNPVAIDFSSGGTITLSLGPIDWVANYVTLDGDFFVTVSGTGLSTGQANFRISGSHNTIAELTIQDAPYDGVQMGDFAGVGGGNYNTIRNSYLVSNGEAGVYVHGSSAGGGQYNSVFQNKIGLLNAYQATCSGGTGNQGDGIYIDDSAYKTVIESNMITCSGYSGISIAGGDISPTATVIQDNLIGLDWAGALPNGLHGIAERQGSYTGIYSNTISGNGQDGVYLSHSTGAVLNANMIGTDEAGMSAIPNGRYGVLITDEASNNTVGGHSSVDERNVISGNTDCGVSLRDGAINNEVDFNLIGLDKNGREAIPNGLAGVCISKADNNYIGTSMYGVSQYISGNTSDGIYIESSSDTFIGQTNRIGVAADNLTARGNGYVGILLMYSQDTSIFPSIVSYNGGPGVAVVGNDATGNKILPMHVHSNGGLPIDLGNDGPTPNGSHTPPGPNDWQNYPVITSAGGSPTTLQGTACAGCTVIVYRAIGDTAAVDGGGDYVDETTASTSGAWSVTLPPGLGRNNVSLVAVDPFDMWTGNTSEMSPARSFWLFLPLVRR